MTMLVFLLALATETAMPRVTVEGSAVCPAPAEVQAQLQRLLPPLSTGTAAKVAEIDERADGIHIALRHHLLGPIAARVLPRMAPCATMAAKAALIIAAWDSDANAEFVGALPRWPRDVGTGPAAVPAVRVQPATLVESTPFAYDAGLGVANSWWGSWGPVFVGRATLTPSQQGLGFTLFAAWDSRRWMAFATGGARWQRWAGGVGVHHRQRRSSLAVDLRAEVGAAWIVVSGVGFVENYRTAGLEPELGLGIRLAGTFLPSRLPLLPWLDLGVTALPVRLRAVELRSHESRALPPVAATLAVGVSFGRLR